MIIYHIFTIVSINPKLCNKIFYIRRIFIAKTLLSIFPINTPHFYYSLYYFSLILASGTTYPYLISHRELNLPILHRKLYPVDTILLEYNDTKK